MDCLYEQFHVSLKKKYQEEDNQKLASKKQGIFTFFTLLDRHWCRLFTHRNGLGSNSLPDFGKFACFGLRFPRSITGKNHPTKSNHSNPAGESC